jgi:hypothetical protein
MEFVGKVDANGGLRVINRGLFDEAMSRLAGCDVVIEVSKKIHKRSNSLNAYYWSGVIPLIRAALVDLGHVLTKEEVHQFLKMRFIKTEICNGDGEVIGERTKSSTELTTTEFLEYLEQIKQFSAEILGVYIPDPNEQSKISI